MKVFIDFLQAAETTPDVTTEIASVSSSRVLTMLQEAVESSLDRHGITSGTISLGFCAIWPEIVIDVYLFLRFLRIEAGALKRVVELVWPIRAAGC